MTECRCRTQAPPKDGNKYSHSQGERLVLVIKLYLLQGSLEIIDADLVWIVRWGPESNRKVTECDVEIVLHRMSGFEEIHTEADRRLTSTCLEVSNSVSMVCAMAKAAIRFRGSFSPKARVA